LFCVARSGFRVDTHLLFEFAAALSAKVGAGQQQHFGMVRQTVQASRGQERVAKQVWPFCRGAVTGQYDAASFVATLTSANKMSY